MKKFLLVIFAIAVSVAGQNSAQAKVIAGKACQAKGEQTTVSNKLYTCIKTGKKLVWNKGTSIKPQVATSSATASPSNSTSATPTPNTNKTSETVKTFDLVPTFSMSAYSERLRRYKDRPEGYLYIEQTRGVVQILLPTIPSLDSTSEYFVVIGGGSVFRQCNSGDLKLPLDTRAEKDKKSVLYSLLPRGPKGFPVGIVFRVSTFPISFTCQYGNEIKYSVKVVETDKLITKVKSQSRPVDFVTPVQWINLPQPTATPTPTQINTFAITPNAVCSPEGTAVTSTDGKDYVCKSSATDDILRWTL